ncbi:MAG: PAS domain S-box protein [Pyrinomonadaceae bacterium]|nr:PAS domain S-box protein [Pyrinomonadaceae bacterium]
MKRPFDEPASSRRGEETPVPEESPALFDKAGQSDGRFLSFADTAADAIIVIDSASRILFVNRAAEKIFGYAVDELLGQSLTLLMPDYLRHVHRAGLGRYIADSVKHIAWSGVELPGLHRGGREIPLEISFGEFTLEGRKFFTGIARDITKRKRAEEAQQFMIDASELLAASLDHQTNLRRLAQLCVPYLADWCGVALLDADGSISFAAVAHADPAQAERAARLVELGQTKFEPPVAAAAIHTGKSQFHPDVTDELLKALMPNPAHLSVMREMNLRSLMAVPLGARGRTFGALSFGAAQSNRRYTEIDLRQAEDLGRRVALALDHSRMYREAQEANRLKDEFLATLSHELRTPLTSILGWAGLLRSARNIDPAQAERALEVIERNARAQNQLIDDLLDASRIITGHLRIEARPIALGPIVEAAVEAALPLARTKNVNLASVSDPKVGLIKGDAGRLQQIVGNLLSNAIKFTPGGGRIEVRLECEGTRWAQLSVADTGDGISAEFLPFVFERFRQADGTPTRAHGGLGLGLAIVRHLAELHGGTVAAESAGRDQGAKFIVTLPLLLATGPSASRVESAAMGGRATITGNGETKPPRVLANLRILVVEDDEDTLALLGRMLERQGARVTLCSSTQSALAAFSDAMFDLLISDIGLPVEDGYMLMAKIRELEAGQGKSTIPALALTAYAMENDRRRALDAGFQRHLAKPVSPAELVEVAAKLTKRQADEIGESN